LGISNDLLCANLDPEVSTAFERTKTILQNAGVELVEVNFERIMKLHDKCETVMILRAMKTDLTCYLKKYCENLTLEELVEKIASTDVKEYIEKEVMVCTVSNEKFEEVVHVTRPALIKAYHELFEESRISALVFPTLPRMPIKFDDINENTFVEFIRNTSPCSVSGMPG
jgi:Asp-tRNA(Asn)/Glu-tRNA(Gln) amidotransferase A subunit family amidase